MAIGLGFVLSFAGGNNGIADPVATIAYAYGKEVTIWQNRVCYLNTHSVMPRK